MSVIKETTAAKLWCPFSQKDRNCVVGLCMAWQKIDKQEDGMNMGYCILLASKETCKESKVLEETKSAKPRAGTEKIGGRNEYSESGGGADSAGE